MAVLQRTAPILPDPGRLGRGLAVATALILIVLVFVVVGPTIPNGFAFDGRAYWGFPRDPIYAGPGTAMGTASIGTRPPSSRSWSCSRFCRGSCSRSRGWRRRG